ncbi:hypothetical protein PFICI_11614 [Pestalotiopsis fici W106-1]|uniref:Peptidase S33 tripeptidyl aminopeptidase-like C-terminal domain-containing protein n=1 Tax=Pestalotiopsis fici (strain W106-1 / CGMCC3.15140) TaxID=1229662 RepID=W3WSX7_PESFW|nr:uncharacterized protein PFICI_11614 [Pestalotiopsis fici W106-1]ETS76227.1 hypothetical protein PFICI_11614 [Pestalotiopsis fici W106-1]
MKSPIAWAALLPVVLATCSQTCSFDSIIPSQNLTWCPCYTSFYCARLDVPLDYQNPEIGRASIPLLKVPAQNDSLFGPYQGMILINPGGPGASGVETALGNGTLIQSIIGTNWDIIGFDTRGIAYSKPLANCSYGITPTGQSNLSSRTIPRVTDEFFNQWIEYGQDVGKQCESLIGGETSAGQHMSTAVTARDMLSVVDAFAATEDGMRAAKPKELLNYYGISYGTFLGQTFASMFPERVGNMALDGVVSPQGYLANFTSHSVTDLDGIVAAFFIYCHEAGPSVCPYFTGSTPRDIFDRFNQSFSQLDPQRAQLENWSNATDLEAALVVFKVGILTAVNSPITNFATFAEVLVSLEASIAAQNISTWTQAAEAIYNDPTPVGNTNIEWTLGVLCSDQNNAWYGKTLEDLRPQLAQLESQSIIGEVWSKSMLGCLGWPIKATEIFQGPFGGDTATPLLFVSNTYDPVTPIENSFASAPRYKNAQVLTVDGMGHGISATLNTCAYKKMAAYFQTNALPGNDSFCALESGPFGVILNGTLKENVVIAKLQHLG